MNNLHQAIDVHCALAVSGELDDAAFAALSGHLQECVACRERLAELMWVGSGLIAACERRAMRLRAPAGMRERFVARAVREGVPLKQRRQKVVPYAAAGVLVAAILCAVLVMQRTKPTDAAHESAVVMNDTKLLHGSGSVSETDPDGGVSMYQTTPGHQTAARVVTKGRKSTTIRSRRAPLHIADETRDAFRHGEIATAGNDARLTPVFVWSAGSSNCEEAGVKPSMPSLNAGGTQERRVFCYNPRMASLTSLDLLHAAASNAPPAFNLQALVVSFPGPAAR